MVKQKDDIIRLVEEIKQFGVLNHRDMPWRTTSKNGTIDPYIVLVSELMLQQTQVQRVIPKFLEFTDSYPNLQSLANASLKEVLKAWQGLGYNRRAKYLHDIAKAIATELGGEFPLSIDELVKLKGIGRSTAAAILTYSYNQKHIFIETNVRTVYLHHFFIDQDKVTDKEIEILVTKSLEHVTDYREWYWSLMDYGTYLKKEFGNNIQRSRHYKKQSTFKGSSRELRSKILKLVLNGPVSIYELEHLITDVRLGDILNKMENEGLIRINNEIYTA